MPAKQQSAKPKRAKRNRPDPNFFRARLDEQVWARRAVCTMLRFWQVCGHKQCLRARACALESNDCFARIWPLIPEPTKIFVRAGIEAKAAGLSPPEVAVEIARAQARWCDTQTPSETTSSAPPAAQVAEVAAAPPSRVAAPARVKPRARVL